MIRAKIYRILILGLFYTYNFFGIAAESHKYTITVYSEIIPIYDNTKSKLDLCRLTKTLNSNIDLIAPLGEIKTYTDLMYHLITDTDIDIPLNILVDNFISTKCQLSDNKKLLESNLPIASALINIVTTKRENISRKLIQNYERENKSSEIYPVQLFKVTDEQSQDITVILSEKLSGDILASYIKNYRDKIPANILPENDVMKYQRSITSLILDIIKTKESIFKNQVYTNINYYIDFMLEYFNKIITQRASQLLKIDGVSILMHPMTFEDFAPILSVQNGFRSEDMAIVQQAKLKIEELQKSLDNTLLTPLKTLKETGDFYNFAAYTQLLQLFIFNPYQ